MKADQQNGFDVTPAPHAAVRILLDPHALGMD